MILDCGLSFGLGFVLILSFLVGFDYVSVFRFDLGVCLVWDFRFLSTSAIRGLATLGITVGLTDL